MDFNGIKILSTDREGARVELPWEYEPGNLRLKCRDCVVYAIPRPAYCDRGRWLVMVDPKGIFVVDGADLFPRYYFYWDTMNAEIRQWLRVRKQLPVVDTQVDKETPTGEIKGGE